MKPLRQKKKRLRRPAGRRRRPQSACGCHSPRNCSTRCSGGPSDPRKNRIPRNAATQSKQYMRVFNSRRGVYIQFTTPTTVNSWGRGVSADRRGRSSQKRRIFVVDLESGGGRCSLIASPFLFVAKKKQRLLPRERELSVSTTVKKKIM